MIEVLDAIEVDDLAGVLVLFERSFRLADYVEIRNASLENGLLHDDLVREIPEATKPRAIPIASSSKVLEVEQTKVAA
jgi:molecular chaperone IbpA